MATAVSRQGFDPQNPYNATLQQGTAQQQADAALNWMTWEHAHNPNYQVDTTAFQVVNGRVVERQPGFLLRHPWLFPLIGAGAGLGISALAGPLAAGAGGSGAAISAAPAGTAAVSGPAAAGTGLGLGETGATVGLSGPLAGMPLYDAAGNALAPLASTALPQGLSQLPNVSSRLGSGDVGGMFGTDLPSRVLPQGLSTLPNVGSSLASTSPDLAGILKKLALGLAPAAAAITAHALSPAPPTAPQIPPELTQLLQMTMKRMADQQPLADRVNAGELAGLPRLN